MCQQTHHTQVRKCNRRETQATTVSLDSTFCRSIIRERNDDHDDDDGDNGHDINQVVVTPLGAKISDL